MKLPEVSVIIPCYNQAHYLKECLDSVMAQTFQDFEIIVVDDGSTEMESLKIFESLKYPQTKIIHQKNKGLAEARNTGIQHAQGKYILPLDADDKIAPYVLEKSVSILKKDPKIGIVGGKTAFFGIKQGLFDLPKYSFPEILIKNSLVCSCMFRRSDFKKVGGYNPNMVYGIEDWDFWLSLIELGCQVYQFDEVFLYYRQHQASMIKELKDKNQAQMLQQIVLNHPKLYDQYPYYKNRLLGIVLPKDENRRYLVKFLCLFVPIKSWRHKIRDYYKRG